MSNMIPRRKFVKLLGGGLAAVVLFEVGEEVLQSSPTYLIPEQPVLSLRTPSGSDLLFYGVNLELHKNYLQPQQRETNGQRQPSYLVVQIPALSLHEYAYYAANSRLPPGQQQAIAAGPSYLAFELWPDVPTIPRSWLSCLRLDCTLASLLDWEDMTRFRLLAANEAALDALWPCLHTQATDVGLCPASRPPRADFSYYKWLFRNIFQLSVVPGGPVPPLSLLEVPAGSLMGLMLRKLPTPAPGKVFQPYFATNVNAGPDSLVQHVTRFGSGSQQVRRTIREILQAELRYAATSNPWRLQPRDDYASAINPTSTNASASEKLLAGPIPTTYQAQAASTAGALPPPTLNVTPDSHTPGLRLLAYFRDPANSCQPPTQAGQSPAGPNFLLPGDGDYQQLLVLNQLGLRRCEQAAPEPVTDFRADRYDIRIVSPLVLGGRGASFKAEYKNYDTARIPGTLTLVEYTHHIQDGRDNFIRVAYIGVLAPVDLKVLHVRQARRVVQHGRSYLQYEEHLELLETSKDFDRSRQLPAEEDYELFVADIQDAPTLAAHPSQKFYTRIEADFTQHSIRPVGEFCEHFWPAEEGPAISGLPVGTCPPEGSELLPANYIPLKLPFRYFDANGQLLQQSRHAVQFISRKCFESADHLRELLEPTSSSYLGNIQDDRLQIPLGKQVVALTEDAPAPAQASNGATPAVTPTCNSAALTPTPAGNGAAPADTQALNKPNRLAVEWAEWYYHLAKPSSTTNVFDSARHLVYAQIRHYKAVLDHVQGVAGQPLPSLLEYAPQYLAYKFEAASGAALGNDQLLLMLRHTDDFLQDKLRDWHGRAITAASAAAPLYADLQGGMARIRTVFKQVGERLGGLANPDPVLEHVAGIAQNLALPPVAKLQAIVGGGSAALSRIRRPLDILNGDAAELFNIKIVRLLREELADGDTPQFLLQKFNAGLDTLTATINQLKNPAIRRALEAVQTAQATADALATQLTQAEQNLMKLRGQLQQAYDAVLAQMPDLDKVKNLVLAQLDAQQFDLIIKADPAALALYISRELAPDLTPYVNAGWLALNGKARPEAELTAYLLDQLVPADYEALLTSLVARLKEVLTDTLAHNSAATAELEEAMAQLTPALLHALAEAGQRVLEAVATAQAAADQAQGLVAAVDVLGTKAAALWNLLTSPEQLAAVDYLLLHYDELATRADRDRWQKAVQVVRLSLHTQYQYFVQRRQQVQEAVGILRRSSWLLDTTLVKNAVTTQVSDLAGEYAGRLLQGSTVQALACLAELPAIISQRYEALRQKLWSDIQKQAEYGAAKKVLAAYTKLSKDIHDQEAALRVLADNLRRELEKQARGFLEQFGNAVVLELKELKGEELQQALAAYEQARHFLQTPMRQDLVYDWQTTGFVDVNLGFIRFIPQQNPPTRLKLHASTSLVADASQLPAVTVNVVTRTETTITDFAISFLGALTIDFACIAFQAGSGRSSNLDLRIKGVRFEGPLTFIQALQDTLAGLVDAFLALIQERKITIGYQSPPFSIAVPGFALLNLSFGIGLELFFDRQPMRVAFRLALPDNKAMVAVGVLGGAFYMSLTVTPTEGVVQIEMALEMGALLAFSLGPIRGEVRFMAGLYYLKRERLVVMEGYFIAEGNLKVWFIRVSARLYMGVRSYGSYAEGRCIVSYSVKIGFLKKSFSASYVKTIAGAASQPAEQVGGPVGPTQLAVAFATMSGTSKSAQVQSMTKWLSTESGAATWEDKFQVLSNQEFERFCSTYY